MQAFSLRACARSFSTRAGRPLASNCKRCGSHRTRRGFTLVELVVVVLILGILGAVAAPRAYQAATQATDNGAKKSLRALRDAIDYYKLENGELPGLDGTEATFKADLKPYLRNATFPSCPVGLAKNNSVKITASAGPLAADAMPTEGWCYSTVTGEIIINCSNAVSSDPATTYDEF